MKCRNLLIIVTVVLTSCAATKNPARHQLRLIYKGVIKDDTSYIYVLPYKPGTRHRVIQGYFGVFSHRNRAALDFKMPRGTPVYAARGGVVVRTKQDGRHGGWNKKYRPEGNHIIIEHTDGSRAGYWHLQYNGVAVANGDTVVQGQLIGYSGKTGYAATPHLHFLVWKYDTERKWQPVLTRFQTARAVKYIRAWRSYKAVAADSISP